MALVKKGCVPQHLLSWEEYLMYNSVIMRDCYIKGLGVEHGFFQFKYNTMD